MQPFIEMALEHAWLIVVAVVVAFVLLLKLLSGVEREIYPYARKAVLTDGERHFATTLQRCVPPGVVLLMKVRLADFLEVEMRGTERLKYFGKISQKHADFLFVDAETFDPLLVVELDDRSHRQSRRTMESDAFKDRAYEAAEVPILRIKAARNYKKTEIGREIFHRLRR